MKLWAYDQIVPAAAGAIDKTLADWPYLRQALNEEGIRLPGDTPAATVTKICKLVLAERKTKESMTESMEAKRLQNALLERGIYVSRNDIAECYHGYCEIFASVGWLVLSYWDHVNHIGPVDYIAERISQ